MYLDGSLNIHFYGGNFGTSNASCITITCTVTRTMLSGVTFYADTGAAPQHIFGGARNIATTILDMCDLGGLGLRQRDRRDDDQSHSAAISCIISFSGRKL
jgi:hypothetical protein